VSSFSYELRIAYWGEMWVPPAHSPRQGNDLGWARGMGGGTSKFHHEVSGSSHWVAAQKGALLSSWGKDVAGQGCLIVKEYYQKTRKSHIAHGILKADENLD